MQELSTSYDADVVNAFFKGRPWLVAGRVLDVAKQGVSLFLKLKLGGKEVSLAGEISGVLSRAGPTFVKLGQTLSTREDLVGRDVARALADLQMAAPPFPDAVAMDIITAELGGLPAEIFGTFSQRYVAAASMGQVYKATLKSTGEEVAVKVQRPDLLGSIALDVYVLRLCLGAIRFLAKINSDVRSIADEVGAGLFAELDYTVEASQVCVHRSLFPDVREWRKNRLVCMHSTRLTVLLALQVESWSDAWRQVSAASDIRIAC